MRRKSQYSLKNPWWLFPSNTSLHYFIYYVIRSYWIIKIPIPHEIPPAQAVLLPIVHYHFSVILDNEMTHIPCKKKYFFLSIHFLFSGTTSVQSSLQSYKIIIDYLFKAAKVMSKQWSNAISTSLFCRNKFLKFIYWLFHLFTLAIISPMFALSYTCIFYISFPCSKSIH